MLSADAIFMATRDFRLDDILKAPDSPFRKEDLCRFFYTFFSQGYYSRDFFDEHTCKDCASLDEKDEKISSLEEDNDKIQKRRIELSEEVRELTIERDKLKGELNATFQVLFCLKENNKDLHNELRNITSETLLKFEDKEKNYLKMISNQ